MSHDATAWARQQTTGNTVAKFLLLTLADYAGTDYSCWPGQESLAKTTETTERTIRRATNLLVELGLIRVFYRYRDDNSRRSCRYQLLIDGPDTELPDTTDWRRIKQAEPDSVTDSEPDSVTSSPGQAVQQYRSEGPVIPAKEPSKEPSPVIPGAARTARGTRLPEDFAPDEGLRKWYAAEQLENAISGRIEHQKFMNYWLSKPGAAGRKTDWRRTWMNWMLSAAQRGGARPGATGQYKPSTTDQRVAQGMALAEKFRQMEESA